MQKQITVLIDEEGNSSVDLTGFTDGTCGSVMKDFQGDDHVVHEHKKPEFYRTAQQRKDEREHTRR
jgi:hypothetical protein